jgi:hypothetical protein
VKCGGVRRCGMDICRPGVSPSCQMPQN